jgi:aldehyde:ferredoxin oxidoreductase
VRAVHGPPELAELIAYVTGWDFGWEEALKAGRRILTLRQAFNAREGLTPDQIDLPERLKNEPLKSGKDTLPRIDFQALREGFFTAMGWDAKTGIPHRKTLVDLGLDTLAGGPFV